MSYYISSSLSDLLHSAWHSLGPSMLLQMALFHSFYGWIVFYCIYVTHLVYPFICNWTFRLFPCLGYCKQCCMNTGVHISFQIMFFSRYMPRSQTAGSYGSPIFSFFMEPPYCSPQWLYQFTFPEPQSSWLESPYCPFTTRQIHRMQNWLCTS